MTNATISSKEIQADCMNRDEQNLMSSLANGLPGFNFTRAQMVTARRLARKGLVKITRVGEGRDAITTVRRTDWKELERAILEPHGY